jgi:hypothetical protein
VFRNMRCDWRKITSHVFNRLGLGVVIILLGCCGGRAYAVGASTPFISYEAEVGALGGGASVVSLTATPTNEYSSPPLEASGHAYVQLTSPGQYVQWTNNTGLNITALNLRSCIPDAPAGGGITSTIDLYVNGVFRQSFGVNSLQNYCYEGTNYNGQADKNPADGDPRGFWNDTHAFIAGAALAPGSTFRFQMDSSNIAAFYYLDVVDLEAPPPPLTQPANSLSILSYGAVSNNPAVDNTAAINNCFNAALAQGEIAWIPPGTYYISAINGGLNASGITISGAGPWYSTIYRVTPANNTQGVANILTTVSCSVSNLMLDCNANNRAGNNNNGAVDASGNNWVVDNVWIQHATSSFWCAGLDGIARNCRTLSTWADGGNFNNVQSANGIGMNLTYSNNFVRGTGDDAMAINSVDYNGSTYYPIMSNIAYVNNTALCAWGGKNMGIYGGMNDIVTNNLLCDNARYLGLGVTRFGVNGSDLQSAIVTGNVLLRCGGNGYNQQQQGMMIGNGGDGQGVGMVADAYCAGNIISNSLYDAVGFSTSTNIVFQFNTIINPGFDNIAIGPPSLGPGVLGNAVIRSNTVTGLATGRMVLTNAASGYSAILPVSATSYALASGVTTGPCSEGGQNLTGIAAGDWSAYTNIVLTGVNAFVARVAGAGQGGGVEIRLDSPAGTLLGTCPVPGTGGTGTFVNVFASLSSTNGIHTVYLVYTGGGGVLFNVEFFGLFAASPALSYQLVPGNTYSLNALVNGKYITAANSTSALIAQGTAVGPAQEFEVFDAGGGNIALLSQADSLYVSADSDGASPLIANRTAFGSWETFTEFAAGGGNIALRAMDNGEFVTAEDRGTNALIADASSIGLGQSFQVGFVSGVAPAAPNDVTGTPDNAGITLNWAAATGATGYNIEYATTSGSGYTMLATNVTGTSYTSPGFVNGTTYYFVVAAENSAGVSANSAQVTVTPGTLNRAYWVATSSTTGGDTPGNALDGDLTTRWSTDTSQVSGQWFEVDMGWPATFNKIVLNNVNSASDYPRGYQVNVSNDGLNWGSPVVTGTGNSGTTTITFAAQAARYLRITQTGSVSGLYWSIDEFNVFGTVPAIPAGLTAAAFSSSQISLFWQASVSASGYNVKRVPMTGGTYVTVATNLTGLSFTDTGLTAGTTYYYVVTATNSFGESGNSVPASASTVSLTPPRLLSAVNCGQLELSWPLDHLGWRLEVQTNLLTSGLGTNWVTVANSPATNQVFASINAAGASAFYRLVYP